MLLLMMFGDQKEQMYPKCNLATLCKIRRILQQHEKTKSRRVLRNGPFLVSDSGILMSGYYPATCDIALWKEAHNITHVINMAHGDTLADENRQEVHEALGIKYLGIEALDCVGYDILHCLPQVLEFAEDFYREQNGNARLLIHCMAGVNRSGAIAVALVCYKENKLLLSAIQQVYMKRGPILTNKWFQNELINWAREHNRL